MTNKEAIAELLKENEELEKAIKEIIAEIEQLNENDYPQMDRTISKFKDIVLEIIYKHTGIGDEYDKGRNTGTTTCN